MKFSYKTVLSGLMALNSMIGCKPNPDLPPQVQKGTITGIAEKAAPAKGYYLTDDQGHIYDLMVSENKVTDGTIIFEQGRVNDTVYLLYQNRELCGQNGADGMLPTDSNGQTYPVTEYGVNIRELKKLPDGVKIRFQYPCN